MIKTAALFLWISGLGFGLPCIYGIWRLVNGKGIAYLMGFPTYGNGPFEKIGVHTTTLLLIGFLLVCALECTAGLGLWRGDKAGHVQGRLLRQVMFKHYIAGPLFTIQ